MYLKKIKMFGFKSFADELGFEFDPGITAIVGPNGCGKSNVLDAFNWVLGEQSSSRLRGGEMQDMIFKGSKSRKPLGFAFVELCLDNSKDMLPIDYDEITVARKLYRSGESEYFINKNPCRLKDIKELFIDTGIGTRSYSVMEQDNVRFILQSSPEDRRGIIEEAAGIRRYNEKKQEAERRLMRIRDDLKEVKNIMAEVQKNIRKLKRQTQRAQRYNEFSKRLRFLEVSKLCQDYDEIQKKLGGESKNVGGLEDKVAEMAAIRDKFAARITGIEQRKEKFDEELLTKNREVYQAESKTEIIQNRISDYDSSQGRLKDEIERHASNYEYNEKRIKQLMQDISDMKESLDSDDEDELKKLGEQCSELADKESEINEKIIQSGDNIEKNEERLFLLREKEIELKNWSEISDKKLKELEDRKDELHNSTEKLNKEINEKTQLINELEEKFAGREKEMETLLGKRNDLDSKLEETESERAALLAKYHERKSEFDSAKKYLPQLISIEEIISSDFEGIEGPVSAKLEEMINEEELQNISKIIGEKAGWMLADNKDHALRAIDYLKEKNLPPLTFILKNSVPEIESGHSIADNLQGGLKGVVRYLVKDVNIDKEMTWHSSCIVSGGGENPKRSRRLLGLESDIEKLKEAHQKIEGQLVGLREEKERTQNALADMSAGKRELQARISPLKENIGQLTGSYEYISDEFSRVSEELKRLAAIEIGELKSILEDIENTKAGLEKERTDLKGKRIAASEVTRELMGLQARKKALDDILGKRKESIESTVQQKEQMEKDNLKLEDLIADLKSKQEYQAKQHTEDYSDIRKLEESKAKLLNHIGEMENERGGIARELNELKGEQKKRETDLEKIKEEMGEQRQTQEILKEKKHNIEIRLREDMGIEIEQALENYHKEAIDEEEIAGLKDKLERIGQVNLEAPHEYEKEFQRFEFIKKHVDDLENSDEDLRKIIRKINKQTKDRFLDTFNAVNENFQSIFTKLFEGGEARLILTEPDNILESGIDIIARPEGKNLTSLKLISGGESTLTAIALMFAIYEVKPTPFCILDEVDSPLDDTNLHRFLMMLKDYTSTTQFIIITHNKLTMQMCDTFYGITMEEFGVSKIISVKLQGKKVG